MNDVPNPGKAAGSPSGDAIKVTVKFLLHFRELFGAKERELFVPQGCPVGELLQSVGDTPERFQALWFNGQLHDHVVIMKNGHPVRSAGDLVTPLLHGDVVAIFPLMAGG
jgi:molybdopterin converting factor small subunit